MIPSTSPINRESTQAQNEKVLSHLKSGKTINFLQAREMGIGFLNSRIAEIRKVVPVASRYIKINQTTCKEYSLPSNILHSSYPEMYDD